MTSVLERGSAWDYLPVEPSPQLPSPEAYAHTTVELAANTRTADELLASFAGCHHDPMVVQAAGIILAHLQNLPGDTWDARWAAFEAATARGPWRSAFSTASWADRSDFLPQAVGHLVYVDAFRPTLLWSNSHRMGIWATFAGWRDPGAMRQFCAQLATLKLTQLSEKQVVLAAGHLCAITGKTIRQLDLGDMLSAERGMHWNAKRFGRGDRSLFATLHALGWVEHSTGIYPQHGKRQGPQTIEQMVDRHHIRQPQRDVWVEYLKHRAAGLDHSTVQAMTYNLVGAFWKDIQDQHPDLETFAVDRQMIDGWRARMEFKADGTVRRGLKTLVIQIRAFYLDIAQWSIGDAYWAQWAVACPISRSEVTKQQKHVRATTARLQQRTRDLAPLLPQIVDLAAAEKARTTKALALAQASRHGDVVELEGQQWTVHRPNDTAQLQLRRDGKFRRVEIDEAIAFWTWAAVEVLRHTGIRIEEMLELTHLALQPYTVPSTRETIPLLHIAPAKTDVERMIVAGPELVHALAEILKRVRVDDAVPLTQRWDHLEHVVSDPLPHLFVRPFVKELRVITGGTIRNHLIVLCRRADLRINGEAVAITPHDFRRLFATEALAAGLPPHIVQVLLGHKSIATTQVYAAIYPQDVIRHHRAFISLRRQTRPTEEYREPTAAEWDEFEAFFVQRKVSLGSCGRAYGTSCHHEHACVRCALLRPDPAQAGTQLPVLSRLRPTPTYVELGHAPDSCPGQGRGRDQRRARRAVVGVSGFSENEARFRRPLPGFASNAGERLGRGRMGRTRSRDGQATTPPLLRRDRTRTPRARAAVGPSSPRPALQPPSGRRSTRLDNRSGRLTMPKIEWETFLPEDHRANRLHDVEYRRPQDPDDPTRFLYSNGPRMVLDQLELFEPLQIVRAPQGTGGGKYRYRITMPDGYPEGLKQTVGVLQEVLTLAYVQHIDVALALDWYKIVEEGVDPMNWRNTDAGRLNNISKYWAEGPDRRRARRELVEILCGVVERHQVLAGCDIVMATPGSKGDGQSHGEQLAEAIAAKTGKRIVKPTSNGPRPERKAGGEPAEDLQVDLVDTFGGEDVLLVDDVFRTGATMRATGLAARRAGAGRVAGLVIARTMRS